MNKILNNEVFNHRYMNINAYYHIARIWSTVVTELVTRTKLPLGDQGYKNKITNLCDYEQIFLPNRPSPGATRTACIREKLFWDRKICYWNKRYQEGREPWSLNPDYFQPGTR